MLKGNAAAEVQFPCLGGAARRLHGRLFGAVYAFNHSSMQRLAPRVVRCPRFHNQRQAHLLSPVGLRWRRLASFPPMSAFHPKQTLEWQQDCQPSLLSPASGALKARLALRLPGPHAFNVSGPLSVLDARSYRTDLHTGAERDKIGRGVDLLCRHCRAIGGAERFENIRSSVVRSPALVRQLRGSVCEVTNR